MSRSRMDRRLAAICGPTAVGKTGLALKLAPAFNAELVSFDSRQVYRGLDIGTGKDLPSGCRFHLWRSLAGFSLGYYLIGRQKIWLYDLSSPDHSLDAVSYARCARLVINKIWRQRKLPILVGGTGFYLQTLLSGLTYAGVKSDPVCRLRLEKLPLSDLHQRLFRIWPERLAKMNRSDRYNPRRLIRAIEIAQSSPSPSLPALQTDRLCLVGLSGPRQLLYQRIDARVKKRLKAGLLKEIEALLSLYSWENSVLGTTLAYSQWRPYFEKKISSAQAVEKWRFAEHAYLRRQLTWFKKMPGITWFEIQKSDLFSSVKALLAGF